jgi:hypothetical protein
MPINMKVCPHDTFIVRTKQQLIKDVATGQVVVNKLSDIRGSTDLSCSVASIPSCAVWGRKARVEVKQMHQINKVSIKDFFGISLWSLDVGSRRR